VGLLGIVFALFTLGYILGVWTSAVVFKERQRAYEEVVAIKLRPSGRRLG
jgi:hypothetical protein